jgi:hypothetical protein
MKPAKHKIWIDAGIKHFSNSGKVEINKLCKEVGLTKPSFYHVYPNWPNSRGMDRFLLDLFKELDNRLVRMELELEAQFNISSISDSVDILLKIIERNFVEFRCLAQLSGNSEHNVSKELFHKHHNFLCLLKQRLFINFYREMSEETAYLICSSILISGYVIAAHDMDKRKWREHVLSVNKQLYQIINIS